MSPAQVENVDQVERLFDFISPLVKDVDQGAEEPDDEVHPHCLYICHC